MTQAARNQFASRVLPISAMQDRHELAVATGRETPVISPALELQKALDEVLSTAPNEPLRYGRLILFGTAMLGAAAVCVGFWWMALSWTASILG